MRISELFEERAKKNEVKKVPLWSQFPTALLEERQRKLRTRAYARGFEQEAFTQDENTLFPRDAWKRVKALPEGVTYQVRYWDLAGTAEEDAEGNTANTASVRLAIAGNTLDTLDFYIVDVDAFQKSPGEIQKHIRKVAERDTEEVRIFMEEEGGGSGKDTIHTYTRLLNGFSFRPHRPTGSKYLRAELVSAQVEAGHFYVLEGKWNKDFFDEAEIFPQGLKDRVDSLSGAYSVIIQRFTKKAGTW